jgi:hypothetical protein
VIALLGATMNNGTDTSFDISSTDTYFLPSAGLSDAQATYLAVAIVLCYCAVMIWVNRKDLG